MARGLSRGPAEASLRSCWAFKPKPEIALMCGGRARRDGGLGTDGGRAGRGARRQTGMRGNIETDRDTDAAPDAECALLQAILV